MKTNYFVQSRRQFFRYLAFGTVAFTTPWALAQDLVRTPRQTEGPFYPDKMPSDMDNDLVVVNGSTTLAKGEVTQLTGRVLGPTGNPVRNVAVEIWQVDNNGVYFHTRSPNRDQHDRNFQGFGRSFTGSSGEYYFRTIKPVPYQFGIRRTPHIHVIVRKGDKRLLTTQMYIKGHPFNERDVVLQSIRGMAAREAVLVDFEPLKGSTTGELSANFDMVIGTTTEDPSEDIFQNRDGLPVESN
jgi:protocatechuate 3,4-dioxygenase beta subunit